MQVYPLLDSVKDTMVASTIRKGDTLRIQAGSLILFFKWFINICDNNNGTMTMIFKVFKVGILTPKQFIIPDAASRLDWNGPHYCKVLDTVQVVPHWREGGIGAS